MTTIDVRPVTLPRVIRSEWVKLTTLRSTIWTLILAVFLLIGFSILISAVVSATIDQASTRDRANFEPIGSTLVGVFFAQLAIGVLGVLTASGEYSTGSIRSTLAAVPRRLPVLWAKIVVLVTSTVVLTGIAVCIAFFAGQALLGDRGIGLGAPGALRALIGVPLYLAAIAALGVSFGFVIRHTAGAIAALVAVLLVLPIVVALIPGTTATSIARYLPAGAGSQVFDVNAGAHPDSLGPWVGYGVLCLWVLASTAVAAVLLTKRDA